MHPRVRVGIAFCWAGAVVACLCWQFRYESTSSDGQHSRTIEAPEFVPSGKPSLVLALHPRCPCSRATVVQLNDIVHAVPVELTVLVTVPGDAGPEWTDAEVCRSARSIPGARLMLDPAGRICSTLGVSASGHVLAFDAHRTLRYSGGVTASRGQLGPNPAVESLRSLLVLLRSDDSSAPPPAAKVLVMPIFGCALVTPGEESERGSTP